ncbi:MAG: hypothetical protein ACI4XC_02945 [Eubacterium sp.]
MAKKEFKAGLYAVISGVIVAVVLVLLTIFAFTTRYTAFKPEKVAQTYVDTIVQSGDGYNAYKNTLVSKNQKYGDFIINAYMLPYVNDGDDVKQAEFVGKGSEEETKAIDTVYETMYDYYVELINTYGYDDYDSIFSNYFAKLSEVRKEIYGDEYMNTDYMFGAFEANVSTYGKSLTGSDETLAADGKTVLQEASTGVYQTMYGDDYKLTAAVKECTALSEDEAKAYVAEYKDRITPVAQSGEAKADEFGLVDDPEGDTPKSDMASAFSKLDSSEDITAVDKCIVEVTLADGTVVATQELYVVQIGNSWYVDNTNVDTSALYLAK